MKGRRGEVLALFAIVAVAAALRLVGLEDRPGHLNGDEASFGIEAQRILGGELHYPFGLMWGSTATLSGYVFALSYDAANRSVAGLRFPGALAGTLAVAALYLLARGLSTRRVALGAAALLATLPLHVHYSRIAIGVSWDSLTFTTAAAAVWWGLRSSGPATPLLLLAGLVAGFGQYAYTGSRLLPALLLGVLAAHAVLDRRRLAGKGTGIAALTLLWLVVAAPFYLHGFRYPDDFNARLHQVGIVPSGWLQSEAAAREVGEGTILAEQAREAVLGFFVRDDRTETWGARTPLVPPLVGVGLALGLLLSLRRWRRPETALIHGWFWSIVILAGALTADPPTSNRLVSVMPLVCLIAALGWDEIAARLGRGDPRRTRAWALAAIGAAVAANLLAVAQRREEIPYGGRNARTATFVGRELARRPTSTTLVFLGAPAVYAGISPIPFLAPAHPRHDVLTAATSLPADLPAGDLWVVAIPARAGELDVFAPIALGDASVFRDPRNGEVLFHALPARSRQ
jgi:4-amino-4-deoxy-L-arabinose transferase-like glycosyltransferase